LGSISHRLTREQVKPNLLPMHRTVQLCEMSREDGQRYKALESALGRKALTGRGKEQLTALKTLAATALGVKVDAALARIAHHCGTRGKKVLVAAHWHESLEAVAAKLTQLGWPHYCAGGWMPPERRKRVTAEWAADPRSTPLLVNIVASGVGIDLSDADGSIVLEVPWVPADALQFEPRIIDVHLGKRTSQPWIEYLLSRGTTDEDMALANLRKIATIDVVVGAERESTGLAASLRASGVVDTVDLGLIDKSDDAVEAALAGLRARLAGLDEAVSDPSGMSSAALAGAVAEAFEEEEKETDDAAYDAAAQ
jgi:SNF2 family DNA or RNA helicase